MKTTKTTLVFRTEDPSGGGTVRFTSYNAPQLLVGDSFLLPLMTNLGLAQVTGRHWEGQRLFVQCTVGRFLFADLVKQATKIACYIDDYELPDQDWSQPFE
jgi:hypothetical protein